MVKVSALSKLLISLLACVWLPGTAQLTMNGDDDLLVPDRVVERLRRAPTKDEERLEKLAGRYLREEEARQIKKGNTGAVVKSRGEVAIANPMPRNILAFAEIYLKNPIRPREDRTIERQIHFRLELHTKYTASALAGNTVVKQLGYSEVQKLVAEKKCIEAFLETKIDTKDCRPVSVVKAAVKL